MDEATNPPRWNIFARELADILAKRGLRLGHLNDRAGIHPQKVSRLQRSLREPKFNMLSPEDLETIERTFDLTNEEVLRLRAAILATAIEVTLMNRISSLDAFMAAQQIFPTLLQAVGQSVSESSGMGAVKGMPVTTESTVTESANDVLDQVDLALIYCQLTLAANREFGLDYALMARAVLHAAISTGDARPLSEQSALEWSFWRAECLRALMAIERYIG